MRDFTDRADAGARLARVLLGLQREGRWKPVFPVVVGLPRGGLPVAAAVAETIRAPLDVLLVRKLGVPGQPELAMGAVGEAGVIVRNEAILRHLSIGESEFEAVVARERAVLADRAVSYRGVRPAVPMAGRSVVVVDDGIATGATARAACAVAIAGQAGSVVVAAPVIAAPAGTDLGSVADNVIAVLWPNDFSGVGEFYRDFRQTSDAEVLTLLAEAAKNDRAPTAE
jgi:predicted phosphoribosyltransferase